MRIPHAFALTVVALVSCHDQPPGPPPCEPRAVLRNGTFLTTIQSIRNMDGVEPEGWMPGYRSPQIAAGRGSDSSRGYVQMWGNANVGESVVQHLSTPIQAGRRYRLSASTKMMRADPSLTTDHVIVRFVAFNTAAIPNGPGHGRGPSSDFTVIGSVRTSGTAWSRTTLPAWTADKAYDGFGINVENDVPDDGTPTTVSWGHVDEVDLVELCTD